MKRLVVAWLAIVLATAPAALAGSSASVQGAVRIVPITVSLTVDPSTAVIGAPVHAKASVVNRAQSSVTVSVELRFDPTGLVVKGDKGQGVVIRPGTTASFNWNICGAVAGSYVLLARASVNGTFVDSAARLLRIQPGKKATCK